VVVGLYASLGTGFVLDDWYTLRNAHFDGALAAAGEDQRLARPGAWLVYAVVFGVIGPHPAVVLVLQGAVVAATAVLLVLVLRRFLPSPLATLAAALWVMLPNHTSLEAWASASNIALALLLGVAGCFLLGRSELGTAGIAGAAVLMATAALCYEAVIPAALLAALALPWLADGRPRWAPVVAVGTGLVLVATWILTHWHPGKPVTIGETDLTQAVGAHLGWGVVPAGVAADLVTLVGLAGVTLAVARVVLPSQRGRAGPAEWCVVAGLVVIGVGTVPFAFYLYAPLGAGDRLTVVSSVGGAMVWAGLVGMAWAWHRLAGAVGLAALVALSAAVRVERAVLWHRAGRDAVAILDGIRERFPEPTGTIVIGPEPIQRDNIAAFVDQSNIDAAVQLVYGDPSVRGGITFSVEQFEQYPPDQRFDIRTVSQLQPSQR